MIGYEFIVMSLVAGACLILMPYVVKKLRLSLVRIKASRSQLAYY